jgi:uncharacterized protein YbjT (DUF2867 family)
MKFLIHRGGSSTMSKIVTVFGATGALGLKITKELIAQGGRVRAVVRATSNRAQLTELGVTDFVTADMMSPASLKAALVRIPTTDAVIACAAGYTAHSKGDTPKTDTEGYRNLIDATKAASVSRFVLISILECDKAQTVPHFYHKYLAEEHLRAVGQPFIALRSGAFLDQTPDFVLSKVTGAVYPAFVPSVSMGMIYTPDLARYAAMAALSLPDSALNTTVDVGWNRPASGDDLAAAFSKVLGKKIVMKPLFPGLAVNVILPVVGLFKQNIRDLFAMIKWIRLGIYTSKDMEPQRQLFGELPTVEEAVRRYCVDRKLV